MSKVVSITSASHFRTLQSSNTYLIVDFYADWCGPCKQIAPVYDQLATQESKPGRLAFVKVNVDSIRDVASTYGVSAMPTFLVLKGTRTVETIRGANPSALRSAVLSAASDAARGPAKASPAFTGKGHTLGGGGTSGSGNAGVGGNVALPNLNLGQVLTGPAAMSRGQGLVPTIVRFMGLYLSTLLSFDPAKTAEESPFRAPQAGLKAR